MNINIRVRIDASMCYSTFQFRRTTNTVAPSQNKNPSKTTNDDEVSLQNTKVHTTFFFHFLLYDQEHHEWDRPIEFVFSLISNSVGLGNVWRFPYLAARSGGGTFFYASFIFLEYVLLSRCFSDSIFHIVFSNRGTSLLLGISVGSIFKSRSCHRVYPR